jgi:glycine cleavage system aminomethyltransferase T
VIKEYKTVMENVGIKDITPFAKFIVEGPQAEAFLDYVVAGSVPKNVYRYN